MENKKKYTEGEEYKDEDLDFLDDFNISMVA
jgi:hypothetical protein